MNFITKNMVNFTYQYWLYYVITYY